MIPCGEACQKGGLFCTGKWPPAPSTRQNLPLRGLMSVRPTGGEEGQLIPCGAARRREVWRFFVVGLSPKTS